MREHGLIHNYIKKSMEGANISYLKIKESLVHLKTVNL
jgi:hypothetical protein